MLSGVKFIPREQIREEALGGGAGSGSDGSEDKRRAKRNRKGRDKDERKGRKHRRRRSKYSSDDSEEGSDSGDSIDEDEEKELSRSNRRSKRRRRRHEFSDDDSEESSGEPDKRRGSGKSKRRGATVDDEDEDEEAGVADEELRASEIVRKEMGLEWMLKSASSGRAESSHSRGTDKDNEEIAQEEVKKANPKELNPYLRDNGSGYPDESSPSNAGNQLLASSVVGDGGASWRLKALKRAKEQAAREGKNLEEVVEERWGSLGHLAASVSASRAAPSHAHLHAIRGRKSGQAGSSEEHVKENLKEGQSGGAGGSREYLRDVSSRHHVMRKPKPDSVPWKRNKHNISSEDQALISSAIAGINKFSNDGSFLEKINNLESKNAKVSTSEVDEPKSDKDSSKKAPPVSTQKLNANQLAAKILQLRMKGKHEEAEQLSREMEAVLENEDTAVQEPRHEVRSSTRHTIKPSAADRRKREEDADQHLANKIMHNKQYNMSKSIEDEYDFGDAPSKKGKRKNKEAHEERSTHRHLTTQKERCLYCFENPSRPKHLVVAIGNFAYLMLPQFEPLVPGHCIILPLQHESATRTVDRNAWEEIRNFKKCLLKMFLQQDKDMVFMETVISLSKQRRHCMIECIPIPSNVSNNAPMYFKKAIDEAEEEWTQHDMKKLIPTKGNLHQVIPENFAYFHVEFGLDRGFVHVIDDESKFSAGFGLNVIRGMLRLREEDMHRRRRHESMDNQKQAVANFMKDWEPFDWTKQLD
ncbi:CWF19-like protein 2 [Oryza brachyantha]|uniref:Cwf19-like C-terminal domain-containing protein n=1 Tax=Oryza brachyantha TaxID=4533 RepID=J3LSP0_ORYBR|nr:CWF19-like protein 2 [Oryza brachyantha]